jgi:Ala-tRNA(Pro) deacylase
MFEKLREFLQARGAAFEVVRHPGAVTAQEQAATQHRSGWSVAKVVIVKERDGLVMVVVPAACVVDLHRLKGLIGHGDVELAGMEEIRRAIPDCLPGAIPPFGQLFGLRSFVDRTLLNQRETTMPAGDLETSFQMRTAEFRRLGRFEEGDFAVAETVMSPIRTSARPKPSRPRRPRAPRRTVRGA